MSVTATAIRPFQIGIPEEQLAELRRRIEATRWPTRELAADRSQGVQLATLQALVRYWATEYDWRACEARLNALPQFTTEIDGVDIPLRPHQVGARERPAVDHDPWLARLRRRADRLRRPPDGPDRARRQRRGCLPSGSALPAWLRVLGRAGRSRLGPGPGSDGPGPSSCADSATPGMSPRAATWAPASPTRWDARHPRG